MVIPKEILNASLNNDFVIFVGSGFSKPLGFKDWNQLANLAIDQFADEYPDKSSALSMLKKCLKGDVLDEILIFDALYRINAHKIETIIQNENNITYDESGLNNHKLLWECSSRIITTNYDKVLDDSRPNKSIQTICHDYRHEVANNLDKPQWLYHIHGIVDNIRKCVIFSKNYVDLYNDRNPALEQLKAILQNKTILFIGFSMKDRYVSKVLENLNVIFESQNNNKRYILLNKNELPSQKYLTKLPLDDYSKMTEFLVLLRDEIRRYPRNKTKVVRYNRHRCYSFQLGTDGFNNLLHKLLNDPVSIEINITSEIEKQINQLISPYEKAIALAVHNENLGHIEKNIFLLKDLKFVGNEEDSRLLYLALAYEKMEFISEAIDLLYSVLSNPAVDREIRLCANFNLCLCYEKKKEFTKARFEDFFGIEDTLRFSKEKIKDKAIANHLIVCHESGKEFMHEHLLAEVLENSLKGSPKLYCKALLNYKTYKNQGITKEEFDKISNLTKDISINTRVGVLCETWMKLDESTQRVTKEEILSRLASADGYSTNKHIQELRNYIASKFPNHEDKL